MLKHNDTCLAKAYPDEMLFVLMARDASAPAIILEWMKRNIGIQPREKLAEAFECAYAMQNLTTKDGKSIVLKSALTFEIFDLLLLYNGLSHPQNTMLGKMMSEASEYIAEKNMDELSQSAIRKHVQAQLSSFDEYGIKNISVQILCFSVVRTYRLIQDQSYLYDEQINMDKALGDAK